ncbi:hypothetical protein NliqN6_5528 [Naganishia liquefaciens]|uniref:Uncharacterized protein n=1 Tax=Naganishia liquefaciens TaxID=104408 RepID=A0A8H3YJ25_9TREE|nr:hypothetical protein NliqN6_5528 [Naganishia liquefaciens]
MLSLTNPFRKPFVTGTQPSVPVSPTEQTATPSSAAQSSVTQTSCAPRPNEHQLSSLLGACESGTHAFSHEDFGGRGSWTSDTFRRTSGGLSTSAESSGGSVVDAPVAARIVSTGWPISRTGSGHFDPSRDPRLLYL